MRQGPSLKMTRPPRPERQGKADAVKPFARLMRLLLGRSPASTTLAAATARTRGPAAATCTAGSTGTAGTAGATAGRHGLRDRGLRPEHLNERLVGALLVGISAADADGTNQLIVDYDRQTTADEVVRQALLFAEIQADQTAVNVFEACGNGG
jgi:hypothetical protein